MGALRCAAVATGAAAGGYLLMASGAVSVDLGVGSRRRELGPIQVSIGASPEVVFDVVAEPYLKRTTRAMAEKLHVLERGSDMVLAEHYTPVYGSRFRATTVETVRFERPHRVAFRLVRGPVPEVSETFDIGPAGDGTELEYRGQMRTDLWRAGAWWGHIVARRWEAAVRASLDSVRSESERRAGHLHSAS